MKTRKRPAFRLAICIDNSEYPASLEMHKVYRIIPDKEAERDGDLRVIDESGEDYLYAADRFVAISIPLEVQKSIDRSVPRRAGRG